MILFKLLVLNPQGKQEIVEVEESGGYYDDSKVIWDERKHGPLPSVTLGAMVVDNSSSSRALKIDEALLQTARAEAAEAAYQSALEDVRQKRAREYPTIGDQLDALYKARFLNDASDLNAFDSRIAEVKAKYPKPAKEAE
jgi:hypothetical protein